MSRTTTSTSSAQAERAAAEIQRLDAEHAFSTSEGRYRAIFNAAVDGLALLSTGGDIVDVNSAMERLYGFSRDELLAAAAFQFTCGASSENWERFAAQILDQNAIPIAEKAVHRDGREFYIEPRGVTVNFQNQPHILVIIHDVTERTIAEKQRTALEARLRQSQKMEDFGQLTGGVAHDFNNILTSILGYVELAHEHVESMDDDKLLRYLDRARRSGEHARELIQKMLTFSRGQHGDASAIDLTEVFTDTVTLIESMMPADIELTWTFAAELPLVMQDSVQVEQVLINLCLNARDAMPAGGALKIALARATGECVVCSSCHSDAHGDFVELVVSDTGTGITSAVRERIFDPFFSTRDAGKSSGLGLSMVHGIVHEHGGHLVVSSEPERGTTIRVLFPVVATAAAVETGISSDARANSLPALDGNILLVDDNADVAEFVEDLLSEWGLEVSVFHDGHAALECFQVNPKRYALAIVDQAMPGISGLDLARLMEKHRPEFPIILYTGHSDAVNDEALRTAGVRVFLQKPLDFSVLRRSIEEILAEDAKPS